MGQPETINELAQDFYEEEDVLKFLRISQRTMRWRRANNTNVPPCFKLGSRWVYPKKLFSKWLADHPIMVSIKK